MKKLNRLPAILGGSPVFDKPVPITQPTIPPTAVLLKKYKQVLKSGMLTNAENVLKFEKMSAEYLGVKHAVAVNSCTGGLMLIMKCLGLAGEVIVPSFTFHATAHAIVWNGLKPVFVDCDPETYNIDVGEIVSAITPGTSAILAVHVFGNPADVESLQKVSEKYNLKLLFDAAHGFGSKRKGKNVGGFGDAESFSLSPTKLLTSGEGGMVTTNDGELARKIRVGRNYGDAGTYDCEFSGFNARMTEFSALLGIESLKFLEKNVRSRNKMVGLYKKFLATLPGISFQKINDGDRSSFKDFSIYINEAKFGLDRNELFDSLLAEKIIVKKYFYPPVHRQKTFLTCNNKNLNNTDRISENVLSLPLYSHISSETVGKICLAVNNIYINRNKIKQNKKKV